MKSQHGHTAQVGEGQARFSALASLESYLVFDMALPSRPEHNLVNKVPTITISKVYGSIPPLKFFLKYTKDRHLLDTCRIMDLFCQCSLQSNCLV